MSNNTRMMADAIAQGITEEDDQVIVRIFNVARHDKNEILSNMFRSKGVLVGSSTMNNVMMPKVAGLLEEITGLRFKNKKAGAFGSYGWNGGAVDRIHARLTDAGFFTTIGLKTKWRPDGKALQECRDHGKKIAKEWAQTERPYDHYTPFTTEVTPTATLQVVIDVPKIVEQTCVVEIEPITETTVKCCAQTAGGQKMLCTVCQWVYDPALGEPNQGVAPGTAWEDVPDSFLCPECGIGKEVFEPIN
jgi:anaerobic nitric oxide reductase flavorubredoxin